MAGDGLWVQRLTMMPTGYRAWAVVVGVFLWAGAIALALTVETPALGWALAGAGLVTVGAGMSGRLPPNAWLILLVPALLLILISAIADSAPLVGVAFWALAGGLYLVSLRAWQAGAGRRFEWEIQPPVEPQDSAGHGSCMACGEALALSPDRGQGQAFLGDCGRCGNPCSAWVNVLVLATHRSGQDGLNLYDLVVHLRDPRDGAEHVELLKSRSPVNGGVRTGHRVTIIKGAGWWLGDDWLLYDNTTSVLVDAGRVRPRMSTARTARLERRWKALRWSLPALLLALVLLAAGAGIRM